MQTNDPYETLLGPCNSGDRVVLPRQMYSKLVSSSSQFVQRTGSYHLHPLLFAGGVGVPFTPMPWTGGYRLDQYIVPRGSILDITSIIFSLKIDPTYPVGYYQWNGSTGDAIADLDNSFHDGITADDHFLDNNLSRFLIRVNERTPFSLGYIRRSQEVTAVGGGDSPVNPPPEAETDLSRYNGNVVLNRNILSQGDLNFHLIANENEYTDFLFQSDIVTTRATGGAEHVLTVALPVPKAEVIVEWCGRLIPKTIFEEVIKANR